MRSILSVGFLAVHERDKFEDEVLAGEELEHPGELLEAVFDEVFRAVDGWEEGLDGLLEFETGDVGSGSEEEFGEAHGQEGGEIRGVEILDDRSVFCAFCSL